MQFVKALPFGGRLIPPTLADELRLETEGTTLTGFAKHGLFSITRTDSIFEKILHYQTLSLEIRSESVMNILEALNLEKTPEEIRLQILKIWSKPPSVTVFDTSMATTFHSIVNLLSVINPHGFSTGVTRWDAVMGKVSTFTFVIKLGYSAPKLDLTLWNVNADKVTGQVHPNNLSKVLSLITPNLSDNDFLDLCDSVV